MKTKKPIFKAILAVVAGMFLFSAVMSAQNTKVNGTVTGSDGAPLVGVTVIEKGTMNGTATDIDGKFVLEVNGTPSGKTLTFSCIGYESKDVVLSSSAVDVVLDVDTDLLEEVVVVGYGVVKKKDLTGSVASANIKDFENVPNTNLISSLAGQVAGLNIGQATSAASTPSISIRGKHTLSGSTDVLIVLDGIPYRSSLSSINPNDIESVDVLKDASASAIYGAQAANGVLLITTKKGKAGAPKVSFSSSYTITNASKSLRPMNREEYLQRIKDLYYEKAYTEESGYTMENPDFDLSLYLPDDPMLDSSQPDGISALDYDWYGEGTQTGHILENRLNISGANDFVSYMLSYENMDQSGIIKYDDAKRNSIRMNVEVKPYKWLTLGTQAFGSFMNQDGAEPSLGTLISMSPLISPYDKDGNIVSNPFKTLDTNPFIASDVEDKERHNYFFANVYGVVNLPLKGLTYRMNYGNNLRLDQSYRANEHGASQTGEAYKNYTVYYEYTIDNILNYQNTFGKHFVDATFVYGANGRQQDYTSARSNKFERLTLGYNNLGLGADQYTTSSAWKEQFLYQMLRLNYNYDSRYLVTATVRRDGFSGFGENNKIAVFPSVALAWRISEEDFFKVSWVDDLKLRAGYGVSGNMLNSYQSIATVSTQPGYVFGDGGSTETRQQITKMANKDLKWERTSGFNVGVDFAVLNNRITGSFEYFNTKTNDLLYNMTIPAMTGFTSVITNLGQVANQGWEFTVTSHNISRKNFEWSTTLNASHSANKIVTLNGNDLDGDGKEDDLIASGLFIGESLSTIYGYKTDGIWQLGDDIPTGYYPGNYKVVDTDKDGDVDIDDRVILGQSDPILRLSLVNRFRYKNWTLSFLINSIIGGERSYLSSNSSFLHPGNANNVRWNIMSEQASLYWSPRNPDGIYAMATKSGRITPTRYETRTFVRLQDVNLSYSLPQSLFKGTRISALNVFFSGKNLLTLTGWHGNDPETGSGYGGRPLYRNFCFGLNITF